MYGNYLVLRQRTPAMINMFGRFPVLSQRTTENYNILPNPNVFGIIGEELIENKTGKTCKEPLQPYTLDDLQPRNVLAFSMSVYLLCMFCENCAVCAWSGI